MVKVKQVYSQGKHDFNLARPLVEAANGLSLANHRVCLELAGHLL